MNQYLLAQRGKKIEMVVVGSPPHDFKVGDPLEREDGFWKVVKVFKGMEADVIHGLQMILLHSRGRELHDIFKFEIDLEQKEG